MANMRAKQQFDEGLSFHLFTADKERAQQWIAKPGNNIVIHKNTKNIFKALHSSPFCWWWKSFKAHWKK